MLPRRLTRLLAALPVAAALAVPGLTAPTTAAAASSPASFAWAASLGSGSLAPGGVNQPYSSPAVGRLKGPGAEVEIVTGSLDGWVRVFHSTGGLDWQRNTGGAIQSSPTLADLRGNGELEGRGQRDILVGSDSNGGVEPNPPGGVWWAFRPDGSLIWKRLQDEVPWASPSAAILNPNDIQPTIVAGTGHYFHQTVSASRGDYINVYNANGTDRYGHSLGT